MGSISDIQKRLRGYDANNVAQNSLLDSADLIIKVQQEQLLRGERADGAKIGKYRNPAYAAKKNSLNPLAGLGNVDLKLTGELYKEVLLDVRDDSFVLVSGDTKTPGLIEKYGDPFGLSAKGRTKVINEKLQSIFVKRSKESLQL